MWKAAFHLNWPWLIVYHFRNRSNLIRRIGQFDSDRWGHVDRSLFGSAFLSETKSENYSMNGYSENIFISSMNCHFLWSYENSSCFYCSIASSWFLRLSSSISNLPMNTSYSKPKLMKFPESHQHSYGYHCLKVGHLRGHRLRGTPFWYRSFSLVLMPFCSLLNLNYLDFSWFWRH